MVVSGGGTSTPLIRNRAEKAGGGYAAKLFAELPKGAPPANGPRLASFFCCGGGIDLGFRSAGFLLAFANDISARACETYAANLGHAPVHRDIRGVGPADYPAEPVDVVTGGFPCVTFSMAGKRMGIVDDLNGKLYLELCRVISELKPRYFVAENVEGMLSANGGSAVKLVLASFLKLGYRTTYELVNMAEHGVPQTRKRVIFVGVRLDQWRGSFVFPKKSHRLRGDKKSPAWMPSAVSLREAIGDLPAPGERLLGMMHGDAAAKRASGKGMSGGYQNSQPRKASQPSHSQTTQAGVLIDDEHTVSDENILGARNTDFYNPIRDGRRPSPTIVSSRPPELTVANHARNDKPVSPTHAMSKRVASGGRRAPTVVSEAENVQPWINQHEINDRPVCAKYNSDARKRASGGRPSPTVIAETISPWLNQHEINGTPPYEFNQARVAVGHASPAPTMSTPKQNAPFLADAGMRRMTVRECARVQSFPDWYEFRGSQADGYELVGNAVPPLYAKRLALAILDYDSRRVME